MTIKSFLFLKYSQWKVKKESETHKRASYYQERFLKKILHENKNTLFGKDYHFDKIVKLDDYQSHVPIQTYEEILSYIEKIKQGADHVLTKKKPSYLLMTSGTTSGSKYIPISNSGIRQQIDAALKVLCFYANHIGHADFVNYKMIFLQGSPVLEESHSIPCGRLSGVVYHHIPKFFQRNKLPSYEANSIEDWQTKIDKIVGETKDQDISVLGGIPPWCLQYFEKLAEESKTQNLKKVFPNLAIYIYGGLDFSNYKTSIQRVLGSAIPCLQTFPASEGFFALQDSIENDDMLLLLNQGIYYEFRTFQREPSETVTIENVKLHTRYELIITNDSGLYRYAMGDVIEFTSLVPYRIKVVGRTSQYISAFGEHVIAYEIEKSLEAATHELKIEIEDYYVTADVTNRHYIWYLELKSTISEDTLKSLELKLDHYLAGMNKYYAHLLGGKIINGCTIVSVAKGHFMHHRREQGKLGGQNKIVRLGMGNFVL